MGYTSSALEDARSMICPMCQSYMTEYPERGVLVDRCFECRALFLDGGELADYFDCSEALETWLRAAMEDLQSTEHGTSCPKCQASMKVAYSPTMRAHICPACQGMMIVERDELYDEDEDEAEEDEFLGAFIELLGNLLVLIDLEEDATMF